jgi:hypothetical protein
MKPRRAPADVVVAVLDDEAASVLVVLVFVAASRLRTSMVEYIARSSGVGLTSAGCSFD